MLNLKNHFFSLLLLCTPIIIISGDESTTPEHFEKFKQRCPEIYTFASGDQATIKKETLKYVGSHIQKACRNCGCMLADGKFSVCRVITNTENNYSHLEFVQLITYNNETSSIEELVMESWKNLH